MTSLARSARIAAFVFVMLTVLLDPLCALAGQSAAAATNALEASNAASRAEYARARAEALARVGPIIEVYEGDRVVLVRGGRKTKEIFDPPASPNLKAVAHVPMGVWAALDLAGDQPISDGRVAELRGFRDTIAAARATLTSNVFPPASLDRQYRLLDESIAMLDGATTRRAVIRTELDAFARRMAPLMLANVREAARGEIDLLHAIITRWRTELGPAEWAQLHVVIMGVHMARDGELAQQYFVRVLGEPGEGRRVVYAEGLFDEGKALDLLATHLIDGRAGAAFFGYDLRMHRDVLGDAAREYLDELGVGP